jgi:hypothetical protein
MAAMEQQEQQDVIHPEHGGDAAAVPKTSGRE